MAVNGNGYENIEQHADSFLKKKWFTKKEIQEFLRSIPNAEPSVHTRISQHIASCYQNVYQDILSGNWKDVTEDNIDQ